jgi:hypothetical protein
MFFFLELVGVFVSRADAGLILKTDGAVNWGSVRQESARKDAGGSISTTRFAARGAPKIRGAAQKSLTLRAWLPTILPCTMVPEA